MLPVTLRPITNPSACLRLRLAEEQQGQVSSPADLLCAAETRGAAIRAVVAGDTLVGMVGMQRGRRGVWWIFGVLIDREYQHRGYGRAALHACIVLLRDEYDAREIRLSVARGNTIAVRLYTALGFRACPEIDFLHGQQVMRLNLMEER